MVKMCLSQKLMKKYQSFVILSMMTIKMIQDMVLNNLLGQFLNISSKNFRIFKTFNSEVSYIEAWLTDQNSKPLETEDKISTTIVLN